jgi:peptidoglycan/xylan/chitin deacetylase (PgdA/CDA1 family)
MMNIPALMYHRVCSDNESYASPFIVQRSVFLSQIKYMARHGYCTPSVEDLGMQGMGVPKGTGKQVLLTFDDGYLDTYDTAYPILKEYGFKAVVFPVTDFARRVNWWDATPGLAGAPLMTAQQIMELRESGAEIGSHGVSHRSFPTLDTGSLRKEMEDSRAALETLLGSPIQTLAYPYGDVDERVKSTAKEAGYRMAFAVNSGPVKFASDLFEIRRVRISNRADAAYLYVKLLGIEKTCRWGVGLAKRVLGKRNAVHPRLREGNATTRAITEPQNKE